MTAPRSGLVAVLFTDLISSTELMSRLGERPFDGLRRQHFAELGRVVAAHGGEEVKNTGDGILAVFSSAAEAVEAAVAMQQATVPQKSPVPLCMRVGVAVGDATRALLGTSLAGLAQGSFEVPDRGPEALESDLGDPDRLEGEHMVGGVAGVLGDADSFVGALEALLEFGLLGFPQDGQLTARGRRIPCRT